jgi:hypothetical protein
MIQDKPLCYEMGPEYLAQNTNKVRKYSRSSSPRSTPVPKKVVRFSDTSIMIVTRPKSQAELQASWYTKHEIKRFRHNAELSARRFCKSRASNVIKHVAYSIMSGSPQSDMSFHHKEVVCGLEHMISPSIMKVLMQRRRMTIARVLEEQQIQAQLGEKDPCRIALASMENSAFTREWRRRIACLHMCDERKVVGFYETALVHSL